MDKRWIYILIILILALISGYYAVMQSTNVGSAITNINTSLITMPADFEVSHSSAKSVELGNGKTAENIYLEDFGKTHDAFERYENNLKETEDYDDLSNIRNSTNTTSTSIKYYTVRYENTTSGINVSKTYFEKNNHTFYLKLTNYKNETSYNSDLRFIIDNLTPDYKKGKD